MEDYHPALVLTQPGILILFSGYFENSQEVDGQNHNDKTKIMSIPKQFVMTSPTFSYDGIYDSLEIKIISSNVEESKFLLEGKFKTLHTGYGDRENADLVEDITPHVIEISIVDNRIISAVIDNRWDELNQITCRTVTC